MQSSKRKFLKTSTAFMAASAATGCNTKPAEILDRGATRRMMINGNMVIPFDSDGALEPEISAQLRRTGLSALKASIGGSAGTYEQAIEELDKYDQGLSDNAHIYVPVRSIKDVDLAFETDRIGIIKSFEAATMLEGNIDRVAEFAARDVKVMQLGYNKRSPFGAGVMSAGSALGLTPLGLDAISAMESSNVLLDLSHAHEVTTWEALEVAAKPPALTHTGCDAIHRHPRNKSDESLRAIAKKGGVVGIYELSYLTPELTQTPLSAYLAHIEHAINVCGEDHVGIGSDVYVLEFDTGPESRKQWDAVTAGRKASGVAAPGEGPMPFVDGLNGPHRMTIIAEKLSGLGYKSAIIDKVMGQNFYRLFSDVWG